MPPVKLNCINIFILTQEDHFYFVFFLFLESFRRSLFSPSSDPENLELILVLCTTFIPLASKKTFYLSLLKIKSSRLVDLNLLNNR
jgi:hypothetical protein